MRIINRILVLLVVMVLGLAGWMTYFSGTPLQLKAEVQEIDIKAGSSLRSVSQQLVKQGVLLEPYSFTLLVRVFGKGNAVKAGNYLVRTGTTPYELFQMLTSGGGTQQFGITFIEGWTFSQMRAELNKHEAVKHVTMAYTDRQIMENIGAVVDGYVLPEGLFFPDTYYFDQGMSDEDILKRAYVAMREKLSSAWENRAGGLPYETPYDALIMASIVEKETGKASERAMIAGVFINRLRMGMRLQTDPTVIYGMGESFDGNLRKQDLLRDTPYNTYTRSGLPPTPIAMPGLAAIEAALKPDQTKAIYFVGKGDGSHAFSSSLAEHNRAVARYQLGNK